MNEQHGCLICSQSLVIPRGAALRYIAVALLISLTIFTAGYFLGVHRSVELWCQQQDSCNDLTEHYAQQQSKNKESLIQDEDTSSNSLTKETIVNNLTAMVHQASSLAHLEDTPQTKLAQSPVLASAASSVQACDTTVDESDESSDQAYQALLVGGTKKMVENFINLMKKKDICLELRQRSSISKKGKKYNWYQAVTPPYKNRQDLEALVAVLKKHGKLNDVTIISCS